VPLIVVGPALVEVARFVRLDPDEPQIHRPAQAVGACVPAGIMNAEDLAADGRSELKLGARGKGPRTQEPARSGQPTPRTPARPHSVIGPAAQRQEHPGGASFPLEDHMIYDLAAVILACRRARSAARMAKLFVLRAQPHVQAAARLVRQ
jgi:hypothetical protein